MSRLIRVAVSLAALVLTSSLASAQEPIPEPTGPVVFCGEQTAPTADTYQLIFDGGTAEALTMDATLNAACPAGATHSFSQAASRFTVGDHTLQVIASNEFGSTTGPTYVVTVGIAPGPFTVTAVIAPAE